MSGARIPAAWLFGSAAAMNFSIAAGLLGLQETLAPLLGLSPAEESVALGAAVLGCLAAGETATGYAAASQAISGNDSC